MGRTTILRQLVIFITLPVTLVLVVIAYLNYQNTKSILLESNEKNNGTISNEITNILKFQDFSLEMIETSLDERMEEISHKLANEELNDIDNIESVNLYDVKTRLEMDGELEDIYIIDEKGIVVNSTFKKDIGRNMYEFGEEYEIFLNNIRTTGRLQLEPFSVEAETKKLRKYSYIGTRDKKYVIELGFYSHNAIKVLDQFKDRLNNMAMKHQSISSVDYFIDDEHPVSFNQGAEIEKSHLEVYQKAFREKSICQVIDEKDGKKLYYEFIYISRKKSKLYSSAIIRVISDRSEDEKALQDELFKSLKNFGLVIVIILLIILIISRRLVLPITNLVDKANKIQGGDLSERVIVSGNNEITTLSEGFNSMLEQLEESYNGLEQKVEERTAQLSDKNKKITDSILYAKRIQTAILPSANDLTILGEENFVLFKPMTIVSGDFYWLSQKGNKVMVSAADCTGHGVPGAFMSMIGNTLLNKIVNENNITQPSNILHQLRDEIIESLNQAKDDNLSKDGMDMTICAIDFTAKSLEFSGANSPLVIVRKGELIEYKGNRQPVGMLMGELQPFTNHIIEIEKEDMIYLFSDGFQDQFGGEHGKKFMKRRFKELLVSIAEKSTKEQHDILNRTINQWIKDTRQIDDILVMGIRV